MERQEKNEAIRTSLKRTKEKRESQVPVCVELKIKTSKLSKNEYERLRLLFIECKWLYNYLFSLDREALMSFDTKTSDIYSLDKIRTKSSVISKYPQSSFKASTRTLSIA